MVKINDYLNIKIYKYNSYDSCIFYFFKNNYLIAYMSENKKNFIFVENYNNYKFKKIYSHITDYVDDTKKIDLYEFIFSDDINRLFLNRAKPIIYKGVMKYALKVDKELKEYFKNIIEKEE